jgi:hypothetical protein
MQLLVCAVACRRSYVLQNVHSLSTAGAAVPGQLQDCLCAVATYERAIWWLKQ